MTDKISSVKLPEIQKKQANLNLYLRLLTGVSQKEI